MTILDTRSRDALMVLLQSPKPLTVVQIAEQLDITPRMMRSSLEAVNSWLEEKGEVLMRKPNFGVYVDAPEARKKGLMQELSQQKGYLLYLSQTERIDVLIFMLLRQSSQALQADEIEVVLGISRPTLLKDMHRVEDWFHAAGLEVARRPHMGFQLSGEPARWREAVTSFLLAKFGVIPLLALCIGSGAKLDVHAGSNLDLLNAMILETLQSLDLPFAYNQVKELEHSLRRRFTDVSSASLACHLALALSGAGRQQMPPPAPAPVAGEEKEAVRRMALEIQSQRGVTLSETEMDFFAQQVLGAKVQHTLSDMTRSRGDSENEPETREIVDSIVNEASLYLHPTLKVDRQLMRALSFHVNVAIHRLRYNLPILNPLLEAIQEQYPHILRIARKSVSLFAARMQRPIPEDEIAYIAMHLGAAMERLRPYLGLKRKVWIVCGEGVATAWLLVSRLQAEFPDLEVVEVTSALEITRNPPVDGQVDAILTTVPVEIPGIINISVSPLLSSEDKARIREALTVGATRKVLLRPEFEEAGLPLSALINHQTIRMGVQAHTWEEVIEAAGAILVAVNAISPRYIEAMKDVIWQYGPYVVFAPGVALLHARPEDGVNRLCMSLVTLATPVAFGHPLHDPVSLAIVLGVVDNHSHLRALAQLANLLSDPSRLEQIKSMPTCEDLIALLARET